MRRDIKVTDREHCPDAALSGYSMSKRVKLRREEGAFQQQALAILHNQETSTGRPSLDVK